MTNLGLLLLLVMLFSAFFIAAEAGHDCMGEDCPICACVQQCENTLHRIRLYELNKTA